MHELFLRAKIIWYKRGFHSKPRFAGNRVWNVRLVNICANSQLDTGWTIGEGVYFACDEKYPFPRKLSLNIFGQHVCILRIFKLDFLPKREFHSTFPPCIYFPNLISSFLSSKNSSLSKTRLFEQSKRFKNSTSSTRILYIYISLVSFSCLISKR